MKSIKIVLPNSKIINTIISESSALLIYDKIEELNLGLTRDKIMLKRVLSEDDLKDGEKHYDFGSIKNGETIMTFILEPDKEVLDYVMPLSKLGQSLYGPEYVHSVRYHFKVTDPFYFEVRSLSILHDLDTGKFALEEEFHRGNYSKLNNFKPTLTSIPLRRMHNMNNIQNNLKYSLNDVKWHSNLKDLLRNLPDEEGFSRISEDTIERIEKLYETHKIIVYNN